MHPSLAKLFEYCEQSLQEKSKNFLEVKTDSIATKLSDSLSEPMRKDVLGLHSSILLLNNAPSTINFGILQDLVKVFLVHQVLLRHLPLQNR